MSHPCCVPRVLSTARGADPLVATLELLEAPVPRASFVGVVVDEADRPVAGARLEGLARSPRQPVAQALSFMTDSAGRFAFEVATGSSVVVEASFGEMTSGELELPGEAEARIVVLARARTISGRVIDTSGRPVTDFTITIMSKWFGKSLDISSADGTWRVERVPHMPWAVVELSAAGFLPPSRNAISVGRDQDLSGVDFVVQRGRSISGVVFDQDTARPLPGAGVKALRDFETRARGKGGVRTDAQGRFSLEGLSAGRLELSVTRAGYSSHTVVVGPGDGDVRIGLTAFAERAGKQGDDYEGIGIQFDEGHGYRVKATHPEGGARLAGVEVGDEILAADGVLASSVTSQEFVLQLKGTAGSVVTLTVRRAGREFELHAVRRRLQWDPAR